MIAPTTPLAGPTEPPPAAPQAPTQRAGMRLVPTTHPRPPAGPATGVGVFIDLENLVWGLKRIDTAADLDIPLLLHTARGFGPVLLANAYADWRQMDVNKHQVQLYVNGVELEHVLPKNEKNAADLKLAVDAVEAAFTLPQVGVFVIISGDRDFIHVLKTLRKHGKVVVGISLEGSVSEDFIRLCDHHFTVEMPRRPVPRPFLSFGSQPPARPQPPARVTQQPKANGTPPPAPVTPPAGGAEAVRAGLTRLMAQRPNGVLGANIWRDLEKHLPTGFDVNSLKPLADLLNRFPDVIRNEQRLHTNGKPVGWVVSAGRPPSPPATAVPAPARNGPLPPPLDLSGLEFVHDPTRRHRILTALHDAFAATPHLARAAATDWVLNRHAALVLGRATVSECFTGLLLGGAVLPAAGHPPADDGPFTPAPDLTPGHFVMRYEGWVAGVARRRAEVASVPLTPAALAELMGYAPAEPPGVPGEDGETAADYCARLLALLAAPPPPDAATEDEPDAPTAPGTADEPTPDEPSLWYDPVPARRHRAVAAIIAASQTPDITAEGVFEAVRAAHPDLDLNAGEFGRYVDLLVDGHATVAPPGCPDDGAAVFRYEAELTRRLADIQDRPLTADELADLLGYASTFPPGVGGFNEETSAVYCARLLACPRPDPTATEEPTAEPVHETPAEPTEEPTAGTEADGWDADPPPEAFFAPAVDLPPPATDDGYTGEGFDGLPAEYPPTLEEFGDPPAELPPASPEEQFLPPLPPADVPPNGVADSDPFDGVIELLPDDEPPTPLPTEPPPAG